MAGVIGLHDCTGFVAITKSRAGPVLKGLELGTKPGVTIPIRMGSTIFLPQQDQRQPLALEFGRYLAPVGLGEIAGWASHLLEKGCLERCIVIAPMRERPAVKASLSGTKQ